MNASLRLAAGAIFGASLIWGIWRYGATETWELYRLFLGAAIAVLVCLWTLRGEGMQRRLLFLALVGGFLFVQIALKPTLEGRGYVLAAVGWMALFLSLVVASTGHKAGRGLVFFLILVGGLEAAYGLAQSLGDPTATGDVYRASGARGTFFNRNHFAGMLNLTLPLALGALYASYRRRGGRSETWAWTWVALLSCSFMGLAILVSQSRGGVLTLAATLAFMACVLGLRRRARGRGLPGLAAWLLLLTILGLGLAVGLDALGQRFALLSEGRAGRVPIYADSLRLIGDHPVFGVGPGMYRWRFRPYQTFNPGTRYDHAHNDYLETAAEWGVPVALLFWGFVGWCLYRASRSVFTSRSTFRQGLGLGCAGAIFSILLHSLVDFNLQIPTNLVIFCMILGLAWSLSPESRRSSPAFLESQPAESTVGPAPPLRSRRARRAATPVSSLARSPLLATGKRDVSRLLIRVALTLAILAAGWRVQQQLRAAEIARLEPTAAGLEEAVRLDPEGAGYHFRLGVAYRDLPELQDSSRARGHLERAVALNPYNWRYRRELAQLYELSSQISEAEAAYLAALELSPRSGSYRWRLANFYLRHRALDQALPQLELALAVDGDLLEAALELLLKAGASDQQIDQVWPADRDARRRLVGFLCRRPPATVEGELERPDLLRQLWNRMLADGEPVPIADGEVCVERLLTAGLFEEARNRWAELAGSHDMADLEFERGANLIWNGDFERDFTQAGLAWRARDGDGYAVTRAEGEGSDGSTALRITFDGSRNLSRVGVRQRVIVDPGLVYRLSFQASSQDLGTDQGVYVQVLDGPGRRQLLATEPVLGSTPWRRYSSDFVAENPWIDVLLKRDSSLRFDNRIGGVLWIDSLSLEAVGR